MKKKKPCSRCGFPKPLTDFAKDKYRPDGRTIYCRECKRRDDAARLASPQHRQNMLTAMRKRSEEWRIRMRRLHLCHDCGAPAGDNVRCPKCAAAACIRTQEEKRRAKRECFEHYGGAICACCGETNEAFLTLDHINSDGAIHRKTIMGKNTGTIYVWLRKRGFPGEFQVLCANCNFGRARTKDHICPHKLKET